MPLKRGEDFWRFLIMSEDEDTEKKDNCPECGASLTNIGGDCYKCSKCGHKC